MSDKIKNLIGKKICDNKVVFGEEIVRAWNKIIEEGREETNFWPMEVPKEINLRYFRKTLRKVLSHKSSFLIYDPGFSLNMMFSILKESLERQLFFKDYSDKSKLWWRLENRYSWRKKRASPDYYLLQVNSSAFNETWKQQERGIESDFERPSTRLFLSLVISRFLVKRVYSKEECHWGPEEEKGTRCASRVNNGKITLFNWLEEQPDKNVGINLVRKFDR